MDKFDFTQFSDNELYAMEEKIDIKLGQILVEMRYNEELEDMYQKLEVIREERKRREK